MTCNRCDQPATKRVLNINRRTRKVVLEESLCEVHTQAELRLAVEGLSMTDIDIKPLET